MRCLTVFVSNASYLSSDVTLFLWQIVIILSFCRLLTTGGQYLHQPRVIFEIIGGIVLGPSMLGQIPKFSDICFPPSSLHTIEIIANIGLQLYLFLVGLQLDLEHFVKNVYRCGSIAVFCMAFPFGLGIAISPLLYKEMEEQGGDSSTFSSFFVFIGTALSITAFPVLARILKETGLDVTTAGSITMGAAAINDAIAWILLTLAVSLATSSGSSMAALWLLLAILAYAVVLFTVGRVVTTKAVHFFESHSGLGNKRQTDNNLFAAVIALVLVSAWFTSMLGMDAIIGSFMFGVVVPRKSRVYNHCIDHMEDVLTTFFLPVYFAFSGLHTDFTALKVHPDILITVLVCVVASVGKMVGAGLPAYVSGYTAREAAVVACLMNTRGLMELIVLNIGLKAGVLNERVFAALVIMCIITTLVSFPLAQFIYPVKEQLDEDGRRIQLKLKEWETGIEMKIVRASSSLAYDDSNDGNVDAAGIAQDAAAAPSLQDESHAPPEEERIE